MGDAISVMPHKLRPGGVDETHERQANIGARDRLQATQHGSARDRVKGSYPINGDDGGSGVKLGCNACTTESVPRASRQSKLMRAARFLDGRGILLRQASWDEAAKEVTDNNAALKAW